MPKFKFHVGQHFDNTYIAEGDSVFVAWSDFVNGGDAECVEQNPGVITSGFSQSGVEILNETTGDWEDFDC